MVADFLCVCFQRNCQTSGTHEGTFFGVPATGKQISVQALNIYHFCNGLIVQEYGQPDMLGLLRQIGPVPH
ncbi:ester cyclase [Rhizobium laguerreae]|uniref:ester cyclase n=1 Tax=Rhizobium laguerreae TaxID=1076926 RepID=UPI001C912171|nr:ester cyclase [Rhizobium laguerreae]MBY3259599.1 ester cyclase [Rhizobium laguerreae]MBY3284442.1 ester cyclase [Rhizobium laguerreae]MBY3290413.1 ester cyclase [Rhizobium laguerreae]